MQVQLFKPRIREEAITAVTEVLRSGWIGLGPKTADFEKEFAAYIGAPYCVGLNSCTSALHLAVKLLDLEPGDEVITTPVTFVSTNHVILYERLKPVFADIQPLTGNLDPRSVEERITPRTRAVVAMHYGGCPCDLDELYALGRKHNLAIVEDCAHACGAEYHGKKIGSHGDLHAFSFHAVKNLPTGDGGALTVRSAAHYEKLRRLRWMGIDKNTYERSDAATQKAYSWEYDVREVGFKYHMSDIEAAIAREQLKFLDEDNARRAEIVSMYYSELANVPGLELLRQKADRRSSNHLCCVLAEERDRLVDRLRNSGVGVSVHYRRNDLYPMYEESRVPNAERFCSRVISLPLHLFLQDEDICYVSGLIREGW